MGTDSESKALAWANRAGVLIVERGGRCEASAWLSRREVLLVSGDSPLDAARRMWQELARAGQSPGQFVDFFRRMDR